MGMEEIDSMDAATRRNAIYTKLKATQCPISATALATQFQVSRQIIVGDIALLRAGGLEIIATPRGYLLPQRSSALTKTVACVHGAEGMERELELIVENGCQILDVIVEHPVYGQLTGQLHLMTLHDVQEFVDHVRKHQARPLSALTGGIHFHTLKCPDLECYYRVLDGLKREGFLFQETDRA